MNSTGKITTLFKPSDRGGKKIPAKLVLDNGTEVKSWEHIPAEIGQLVEIEYTSETRGQYTNNMLTSVKVQSSPSPPGGSQGGKGSIDMNASIRSQVCLKAAVELACSFHGQNLSNDRDVWEGTLEKSYQPCINLLECGTLYGLLNDE